MNKLLLWAMAFVLLQTAASARAQITIDTSNAKDWKVSNGVVSVDWLPGNGRIFGMHWSAFPNEQIIDQTNKDHNGPKGFYMDNVGPGSGTPTNGYFLDPNGKYIDWWVQFPAGATNAFTWSQHDILFAGDPGIHIYFVLDHGPGDIAGGIGQIQWVLRSDLSQFTNTYSVNTGLNNLGATTVPMPDSVLFGTGITSGRNVQDATSDLHGLPLPAGFRRGFYTKYDYSSYEYLHKAEGVYGNSMAAWMVVPSSESLTGGPTKQDLIFTGNLLIMEAYSNHLDNQMNFSVPQDAVMHRLYGPFYLHFNAFSTTTPTAASLYQEALAASAAIAPAYDGEAQLLSNGYVPSTGRGEVHAALKSAKGLALNQAWAVLSDNQTNMQYSHAGNEYWMNVNPGGIANFHGVAPGTYRLSVYALGKWGELRQDNVVVSANQTTNTSANFVDEHFGTDAPIWTIGTADRSSHEFLHGQIANPVDLDGNYTDSYTARLGNSVQDDREFWGNWNYWADFAANSGAVVYYATPVGTTPATNDVTKWNYNQWHSFNPKLYAGVYNPADATTDGYKYICPTYVGNCATATIPDWQVHFTTTADQQAQGQYFVLSLALAATEDSPTFSLNGHPLTWHGFNLKNSDAGVRSGFSGTTQWVVLQWDTSMLNPPGQDNIITFHVGRTQGIMYDAQRAEITNTSADHTVTGWNDYEFVYGSTYEPANDAVANQ
ncbi:polysaccharide lyase family protein [Edaphobacter sp.]|uniref:polysaccharide lyase family protein n=1 Tax=Edaphobacter sp. TaxID=1934404 RepID=UPI002DB7FF93|nr:polysaccharide lyase family protein [Edaphobacter sp.]HEU5341511.1 polysaccharide lyase family protein [Edaphobacter sp.]